MKKGPFGAPSVLACCVEDLGHEEGERLEHGHGHNDHGHGQADGQDAEADLALLLTSRNTTLP